MVAIALVVSLSGAVFTFLFNLGRQQESVHGATDALRGAGAFVESLEADVVGAVAGVGGEAGVLGDETSLKLLTRSVVGPAIGGAGSDVGGDLQGVEYEFSESNGTLTARRWDAAGNGAEQAATLAVGVSRLRLRYFDGSAWSESFDSGSGGGLPVAIEVAVWFGPIAALAESTGATAAVGDELGDEFEDLPPVDGLEPDAMLEDEGEILPAPDRVRMIVVPDGPVSAWREGA